MVFPVSASDDSCYIVPAVYLANPYIPRRRLLQTNAADGHQISLIGIREAVNSVGSGRIHAENSRGNSRGEFTRRTARRIRA